MNNDVLNICFYKAIYPTIILFFIENNDQEGLDDGEGFETIKPAADAVFTRIITFYKQKSESAQVNIVFSPLHDISCKPNSDPRRNIPLTSEEQDEFWKYFTRHWQM